MPRSAIAESIREELITATIAPGSWLREEAWADKLGVSRTPLREALVELHRDGLLQKHPRRGFQCPALTVKEMLDLYAVAVAIELVSMRSEAFQPASIREELRELNRELSRSVSDPRRCLELDSRWHVGLVANGGNEVAMLLHRHVWDRIARYEFTYWKYVPNHDYSFKEHDRIIEALEEGDVTLACAQVEAHWRKGTVRSRQWLEDLADRKITGP